MPKAAAGGGKVARVSFNKSGTISFNETACTLVGLGKETKVSLSQDEEEKDNWYFYIDAEAGFDVRTGYDKKGCLFNHSSLVKEVVAHFELPEDSTHSFLIAGKPTIVKNDKTKYWGLIVRSVK